MQPRPVSVKLAKYYTHESTETADYLDFKEIENIIKNNNVNVELNLIPETLLSERQIITK